MDLLRRIRKSAAEKKRHIVLPEGEDDRTVQAAEQLVRKRICDVTLLGESDEIEKRAKGLNVRLDNIRIVNPKHSDTKPVLSERFYNLRKHKGITLQ